LRRLKEGDGVEEGDGEGGKSNGTATTSGNLTWSGWRNQIGQGRT